MAAKLRQIGTVRFDGKAYGPSEAKALAKVLPKEDLERLQNDPRFFRKTESDDEGVVSVADQNDLDSIMDANQLRTLRRQAKGDKESVERIDARLAQLES